MKHQEKIRMLIESVQFDAVYKEKIMRIHTKEEFLKLLDESKITLEPDEIDTYFKGFLKLQEMEKNGDIPEELEEWLSSWNPAHDTMIKL